MKILFLDIDGVLNHQMYESHHETGDSLDPRCTYQLTRVIKATDCKLVISSTWRLNIIGGDFSLYGFETMLSACGVKGARVIGYTHNRGNSRFKQIMDWLKDSDFEIVKYAIVDDDTVCSGQVKPNHQHGLAPWDADELIRILNESD
jgi:hypothetical protein